MPRIGGAEGARAAGWDGARSRYFRSHLLFPNLLCFPPLSQLTSCRVGRAPGESIGAQFPLRVHLLSSSRAISPTHTAASRFFVRPRVAPRTSPCACSRLFALAASVGRLGDAFPREATPYAGRSRRARRLDWKSAQTPKRRLNNYGAIHLFLAAFCLAVVNHYRYELKK